MVAARRKKIKCIHIIQVYQRGTTTIMEQKGGMADETALQVLGVFLTAAYMVVKGKSFMKAIRLWKDAAQKVLQSTRLITSS